MSAGGISVVVFTDLVGSTTMYDRLGDVAAEKLRRDHFALLRSVVNRHDGNVVKSTGDGLMVLFRGAASAIEAAVAMQVAVASAPGTRLELRVGGHVGELSEDDGDFYGLAVNIARRLCDAAASNQILVSDVLRSLASTSVHRRFAPVGELALKGIRAPMPSFEVTWHDGPQAPALPRAIARVVARTFTGRVDEVTTIEKLLRLPRTDPLVCLVAGEPGIGKTRLVAEVARAAVEAGSIVLYGRCDEHPLGAYQPFVEVLQQATDAGAAVPSLLERLVPSTDSDRAEAEGTLDNRAAVFAGFEQLLRGLQDAGRVLLVLDDLHWADDASAALLRHLVRIAAPELCVLGTYRDTELDPRHPLPQLVADLRSDADVHRLDLAGLTVADVADLLDDGGFDSTRIPSLAVDVLSETGGNALFVQEVIRHLQESGATALDAEPPSGVQDIIGRRLSRLPPESVDALRVASIIGRSFPLAVVAEVAQRDPLDLVDLLYKAVEAKLLERVAGRVDTFSFAHALVRDAILVQLPTGRRRRLHARAGDALAARGAEPSEVAYQYLEARDATSPKNAAGWALLVAHIRHMLLGDHEGGLEFATAGIEALGTAAPDREVDVQIVDLLTVRTDANCSLGRFDAAMVDARRGFEASVVLRDVRRAARLATIAGRSVGGAAGPLLDEALAMATATGDLVAIARIEPIRCFFSPASRERHDIAMSALRTGWAHRDPEAITYGALAAADCLFATPSARERLDILHDGMAVALRMDDIARVPFSSRLSATYLELGDRERALATTLEATRVAELQGVDMWTASLLVARRLHDFLDGDFDRVVGELASHTNDEVAGFNAAALMMLTLRERGAGAMTIPLLEPLTTDARTRVAVVAALGLLYAEAGRVDEARDAITEVLPQLTFDRGRVIGLAMSIEAATTIADAGLAETAARDLAGWSGHAVIAQASLCLGSADRYLGMAALATGDAAGAVESLERAVAFDRDRLRSALFTAHSSAWLAHALLTRGEPSDRSRAEALLDEAEAAARAMQAVLVLSRIEAARASA